MGKVLPLETAARTCVAKLAPPKKKTNSRITVLRDKNSFLIVDEAEIC